MSHIPDILSIIRDVQYTKHVRYIKHVSNNRHFVRYLRCMVYKTAKIMSYQLVCRTSHIWGPSVSFYLIDKHTVYRTFIINTKYDIGCFIYRMFCTPETCFLASTQDSSGKRNGQKLGSYVTKINIAIIASMGLKNDKFYNIHL